MPLKTVEKRRKMRIPPVLPGREKAVSKAASAAAICLWQCFLSLGPGQGDALVPGGEGAVRAWWVCGRRVPRGTCPRCLPSHASVRGLHGEAGLPAVSGGGQDIQVGSEEPLALRCPVAALNAEFSLARALPVCTPEG